MLSVEKHHNSTEQRSWPWSRHYCPWGCIYINRTLANLLKWPSKLFCISNATNFRNHYCRMHELYMV